MSTSPGAVASPAIFIVASDGTRFAVPEQAAAFSSLLKGALERWTREHAPPPPADEDDEDETASVSSGDEDSDATVDTYEGETTPDRLDDDSATYTSSQTATHAEGLEERGLLPVPAAFGGAGGRVGSSRGSVTGSSSGLNGGDDKGGGFMHIRRMISVDAVVPEDDAEDDGAHNCTPQGEEGASAGVRDGRPAHTVMEVDGGSATTDSAATAARSPSASGGEVDDVSSDRTASELAGGDSRGTSHASSHAGTPSPHKAGGAAAMASAASPGDPADECNRAKHDGASLAGELDRACLDDEGARPPPPPLPPSASLPSKGSQSQSQSPSNSGGGGSQPRTPQVIDRDTATPSTLDEENEDGEADRRGVESDKEEEAEEAGGEEKAAASVSQGGSVETRAAAGRSGSAPRPCNGTTAAVQPRDDRDDATPEDPPLAPPAPEQEAPDVIVPQASAAGNKEDGHGRTYQSAATLFSPSAAEATSPQRSPGDRAALSRNTHAGGTLAAAGAVVVVAAEAATGDAGDDDDDELLEAAVAAAQAEAALGRGSGSGAEWISPASVHQRTPVMLGDDDEVILLRGDGPEETLTSLARQTSPSPAPPQPTTASPPLSAKNECSSSSKGASQPPPQQQQQQGQDGEHGAADDAAASGVIAAGELRGARITATEILIDLRVPSREGSSSSSSPPSAAIDASATGGSPASIPAHGGGGSGSGSGHAGEGRSPLKATAATTHLCVNYLLHFARANMDFDPAVAAAAAAEDGDGGRSGSPDGGRTGSLVGPSHSDADEEEDGHPALLGTPLPVPLIKRLSAWEQRFLYLTVLGYEEAILESLSKILTPCPHMDYLNPAASLKGDDKVRKLLLVPPPPAAGMQTLRRVMAAAKELRIDALYDLCCAWMADHMTRICYGAADNFEAAHLIRQAFHMSSDWSRRETDCLKVENEWPANEEEC